MTPIKETRHLIRINKYLSLCGVTSRRGAEQLIREKKVTLNNILVEKPGVIVDENTDVVRVNGAIATPVRQKMYILLNKPRMVLTTLHDPFGRRTVAYYFNRLPSRVYPVGRLDYDTQGILILTNDGELAYRLAHPKYEVKKVYEAEVGGAFTSDHSEKISRGIRLEDGHFGRAVVEILFTAEKRSILRLTLIEGHKREVKQLLKAVGHPVRQLLRLEFAGLNAGGLKPGQWRPLTHLEIRRLKDMVGLR